MPLEKASKRSRLGTDWLKRAVVLRHNWARTKDARDEVIVSCLTTETPFTSDGSARVVALPADGERRSAQPQCFCSKHRVELAGAE